MEEKTEIFATHLSNLSPMDRCINVFSGSHCNVSASHSTQLCPLSTSGKMVCNRHWPIANKAKPSSPWLVLLCQAIETANDKKKKLFMIPYEWSELDVAFVALLQESAICTLAILSICGVSSTQWAKIIWTHSAVVRSHHNMNNKNESIKPEVIYNLQESFDWLRELADVMAPCIVGDDQKGHITLQQWQ